MEDHELLLSLLDADPPQSLRRVQPRGFPPLVYCCSICDEDLALRILAAHQCHGLGIDVNEAEPCSHYTPLHFCCELGLPDLARALLQSGAAMERRSEDVVQPFGPPIPGGRTPLHVAAAAGSVGCAELLIAAGADRCALDFDSNTPADLAAAAGRSSLAASLAPAVAEGGSADAADAEGTGRLSGASKSRRDYQAAAERVSRSLQVTGLLAKVHIAARVWSAEHCAGLLRTVLEVAERRGWDSTRHQAYPTTDIKCSEMPHDVDVGVRESIETDVFPRMQSLYNLEAAALRFRDLFFVAYRAADDEAKEGCPKAVEALSDAESLPRVKPQSSLALHRDGSILSFNVLLNHPSEFDGGGTFIEPLQKTFHIGQGDFFFHSGRVLHAGAEITRGERYLLVGFIDAINPDGTHAGA